MEIKRNYLMNNTGLSERDIKTIIDIFQKYPDVTLVHLFGSRAKGNFKKTSDIDLVIKNEGVDTSTLSQIKGDFEESSLPYIVDLENFPDLNHQEIKEHIERVGVEFYHQKSE